MTTRLLATLLAAAAVVALAIGATVRDRTSGADVVIALERADGLREGAPVSYLGVDVGTVRHIDLATGRVVATARLRRSDLRLRRGDVARVRTTGQFREIGIDIMPGPPGAAPLSSTDTLSDLDQSIVPRALVDSATARRRQAANAAAR